MKNKCEPSISLKSLLGPSCSCPWKVKVTVFTFSASILKTIIGKRTFNWWSDNYDKAYQSLHWFEVVGRQLNYCLRKSQVEVVRLLLDTHYIKKQFWHRLCPYNIPWFFFYFLVAEVCKGNYFAVPANTVVLGLAAACPV